METNLNVCVAENTIDMHTCEASQVRKMWFPKRATVFKCCGFKHSYEYKTTTYFNLA